MTRRSSGKSGFEHLFGPVPSRRLGRSLGVDVVPAKTCTFDCLFCEVGRTSVVTGKIGKYTSASSVLAELKTWIDSGGTADCITITGSGEPTLNSELPAIIRGIRRLTRTKIVLLSNGSLFSSKRVRKAAAGADIVKITLSSADEVTYRKLNRPVKGVTLKGVIRGLKAFRREFKGELWVEVVLLAGINDSERAVRKVAAAAKLVSPDKIHLNTVVRPPAYASARPLTDDAMKRLAKLFDPPAEIIGGFKSRGGVKTGITQSALVKMLRRRPCTAADAAATLGIDYPAAMRTLRKMCLSGKVCRRRTGKEIYFAAVG